MEIVVNWSGTNSDDGEVLSLGEVQVKEAAVKHIGDRAGVGEGVILVGSDADLACSHSSLNPSGTLCDIYDENGSYLKSLSHINV